MSTDYEPGVMLGWFIDLDHLKKLCIKKLPVTHEEDRFDPKTGEKVGPVEVIDQPGGLYLNIIDGIEPSYYDDYFEPEAIDYIQSVLDHIGGDGVVVAHQNKHGQVTGVIVGHSIEDMDAEYISKSREMLYNSKIVETFKLSPVDSEPKVISYLNVC